MSSAHCQMFVADIGADVPHVTNLLPMLLRVALSSLPPSPIVKRCPWRKGVGRNLSWMMMLLLLPVESQSTLESAAEANGMNPGGPVGFGFPVPSQELTSSAQCIRLSARAANFAKVESPFDLPLATVGRTFGTPIGIIIVVAITIRATLEEDEEESVWKNSPRWRKISPRSSKQ